MADTLNSNIRLVSPLGVSLSIAACDSTTWHHVAQTYSPLSTPYTLSAFLDGALALQLNTTIALSPAASTLRVGWGGDLATNGGSFFNGLLAELRIYNRTLSTAEVVALSQPPLAAFANTIVEPGQRSAQIPTRSRAYPALLARAACRPRPFLTIVGPGLWAFSHPASCLWPSALATHLSVPLLPRASLSLSCCSRA